MILFVLLSHFFKSEVLETTESFKSSKEAQKYCNEKLSAWLELPPEPASEAERDSDDYKQQLDPDYNPPIHAYDSRIGIADDGKPVQVLHPSSTRVEWITADGEVRDFGVLGGDCDDDDKALYVRNRKFASEYVKQDMRSIILANNMHRCCPTCWKYGTGLCRSCFPFSVQIDFPNQPDYTAEAHMAVRVGSKNRMRNTIESARNNANVNRHGSMPAIPCCWRGNTDATCVILYSTFK